MSNFKRFFTNTNKKLVKSVSLSGLLMLSAMAYADPIEGNWIYYDNQKPRYIVSIKQVGQSFAGVLAAGSKKHTGKTVLTGLSAQGNGKYGGGQAYNPYDGSNYDVELTLRGDVLSMRAYKGFSLFGVTTTLKRLPNGYTFKSGK